MVGLAVNLCHCEKTHLLIVIFTNNVGTTLHASKLCSEVLPPSLEEWSVSIHTSKHTQLDVIAFLTASGHLRCDFEAYIHQGLRSRMRSYPSTEALRNMR